MENKVKYRIVKTLNRIATKEQTMQELVKRELFTTLDKNEAVEYIMSKVAPGVCFEVYYFPFPPSYDTLTAGEVINIDCDMYLLKDGNVAVDVVREVVIRELSKEFGENK